MCIDHGIWLKDPKDRFSSFKLNIKSIINKLKQKYSLNNTEQLGDYIQLDYLNELNEMFIILQKKYNLFLEKYFKQVGPVRDANFI